MVQRVLRWERQRDALVEKDKGPWQSNDVMIFFSNKMYFGAKKIKKKEDKIMVKLEFFFSKLPFLGIY